MTEIEKIEYTKKFIDSLANGINPLDGKPIPDNDIMNNVRLSRCMFFVSDILRQIIENGGITPPKKTPGNKKNDFNLSIEKRELFAYSNVPIPISEITKRLNDLKEDDSMKNITHNMITPWLIQSGILYDTIEDGKSKKRPTEIAEGFGITLEHRNSMNGPYSVVVYNIDAQHFLLDNLDAILSYHQEMKKSENENSPNQYQPWTDEQNQQLINMVSQNIPLAEISSTLQRSQSAILSHMNKLGIS